VLGVTATPERLDGKGLAEIFEVLVVGPTVAELIADAWLSPFTVYAPERLVDLKGASMGAGDYAVGDLARRMSASFVLEDAVRRVRSKPSSSGRVATRRVCARSRRPAGTRPAGFTTGSNHPAKSSFPREGANRGAARLDSHERL
jgi:hypothetical protein